MHVRFIRRTHGRARSRSIRRRRQLGAGHRTLGRRRRPGHSDRQSTARRRADASYVESFINQIDGPVLAVGHSYGGMIITNAVPQTSNVTGLVYVAAFAPDEGETLAGIVGRSTDSVLTTAVLEYQYPTGRGGETATELIIDPAKFREVFTADLPQLQSDVYGWSQRPIAAGALGEETTKVAWKDLPTWVAVGTADRAAGADVVRSMAQRADATITEIEGSHVIMISRPDAVTEVILTARGAVS